MMPDPDWLTHILVAWMLCRLLRLKFRQFNARNTAIAMVGALVPDIVKIAMVFSLFGIDAWNFLNPFHTILGAVLSSGLIALAFRRPLPIFGLLVLGAATHLVLDFMLKFVVGGMPLFFPFSWKEYELRIIQSDDYRVTLVAVALAVILHFGLRAYERKKADAHGAIEG